MVCKKCGKENPEGTRFCAGCGSIMDTPPANEAPVNGANGAYTAPTAPVNEAYTAPAPGAEGAPAYNYGAASGESFMDKVKALWAKREVKLGVAIVAAIVVILLIFGSCGGGASSPEEAAEKYCEAMSSMDIDAMLDCMPPQLAEYAEKEMEENEEEVDALKGMDIDLNIEYEAEEVTDKDKLSKNEIKEIEEDLQRELIQAAVKFDEIDEDEIDEDDYKIEIEEAYEVTVNMEMAGMKQKQKIKVGKIDGNWYVLDMNF
ncbi:MAG: zinc ribbon domain-containing protein [Ruminococcaceae bacterium]|nr:zinc ribbon domain-containing protein [Oscillospiraceae bacterium]